MKITRLSCDCNCSKGTEKGNYTPGPAKGHLDTQLFPESHGTKYDRNVVKKTVDRRKKKSTTAARTKTMVGMDAFQGETGVFDDSKWDDAYAEARLIYKQTKDASANDPSSLFWNTESLKASIKQHLIAKGNDDATADLAAESAIYADSRFRKSKKTANRKVVIKVAQQEDEYESALGNVGRMFGEGESQSEPPKATDISPSTPPAVSSDDVEVIYPDFNELGQKDTKRFKVPVPSEIKQEGTDAVLDYVWRETNHVDGSEWIHDKPLRSSMVGDVYIVNGENWVIMGVGFAKLPIDLEKWINTQDKWKYHSEEDFEKLLHQAFTHKLTKIAAKNAKVASCKECELKR